MSGKLADSRSPSTSPTQRKHFPGALRLWFAFEGSEVRLLRWRSLDMRPPPSDPSRGRILTRPLTGSWIEVGDSRGRLLWLHLLHNPLHRWIEVPTPEGEYSNVAVDHPRGSFTVLVPDLPEARTIAVFATPDHPWRRGTAALEVGRFPFPNRARQS